MENRNVDQMRSYTTRKKAKQGWKRFVRILACFVVFCTVYVLVLPAFTLEEQHGCGLQAHTHSEMCYEAATQSRLICGLEESEEHTHSGECFTTETVEPILVCELTEHTHTTDCDPDLTADVETEADWTATFSHITLTGNRGEDLAAVAGTQLGYRESQRNYQLNEDGTKSGYTRYGDWYGATYGDWNAMFVSFCLHYADIPEADVPRDSDPASWAEKLGSRLTAQRDPQVGDLIFLKDENGEICRVEIVTAVDMDHDETGNLYVSKIRTVGGDRDGEVSKEEYSPDDETIAGFCGVEEEISAPETTPPVETSVPEETTVPVETEPEETTAPTEDPVIEVTVPMQETLPQIENLLAPLASVTYSFTTTSPRDLATNTAYAIYCRSSGDTDTYIFLGAGKNCSPITASNTSVTTNATTAGRTWTLSGSQMNTDNIDDFTWRVVKSGNNYYLRSMRNDMYLSTYNGKVVGATKQGNGTLHSLNTSYFRASCTMQSSTDGTVYKLAYTGGKWTAVDSSGTATDIYFAAVTTNTSNGEMNPSDYPHAVHTGTVTVDALKFYNFCESSGNTISALPGCTFHITGTTSDGQPYEATITSGNNPEILLPTDIQPGSYTITEVSAPQGYMRDVNPVRHFSLERKNGDLVFVEEDPIGIFLNHNENRLDSHKSAEVEDYNNRTYQVMLSASSGMRLYEINPVDVLFVVDQSNSMLFPSGMDETGMSVTLNVNGGDNNVNQLNNLGLRKDMVYYIIADPKGTSTVYAIWFNGRTWLYQDASYYAKAKHDNAIGYQQEDELAIFPVDAAFSDQVTQNDQGQTVKANGGGLSFALGGTLRNDIVGDDGNGTTKTYQIYTAVDEFNRLHYLEEALAYSIYQLADANVENTVTLIRFTREVDEENCMGPMLLTPENVEELVNAVTSINTSGGTRQDVALKHAYDHLTGNITYKDGSNDDKYVKGVDYTFTVLITDGAPVLSGTDDVEYMVLGDANDGIPTTGAVNSAPEKTKEQNEAANVTVYGQIKYYGQQVRKESLLMTVGLGMDNVEGGKQVLKSIATYESYSHNLKKASELMDILKQLLFSSMTPKDKLTLTGDITDVISDSFYPIAWVAKGRGAASGRNVLYSDDSYDWLLLQSGDWITLDGEFVGVNQGTTGQGQLYTDENGDFCVRWLDQLLADVPLGWVTSGSQVPNGRTVVRSEDGKDWFDLRIGDRVTKDFQYVTRGGASTGTLSEDEDGYYIRWSDGTIQREYENLGWNGTFYLKAKEDFIGGNDIDTNKYAHITFKDGDDVAGNEFTEYFPIPNVNVRLLDMNQNFSQVTVFLGDRINGDVGREVLSTPLGSLQDFFDKTRFEKLVADFPGFGDVMNAVDPNGDAADGLETDVFYLKYAMGGLTADQWKTLTETDENGNPKTVTVEYTYDNPSSHGPVGYFTFWLTKNGDTAAYDAHEATEVCQSQGKPATENCDSPVETYTLHVTYTAYTLAERALTNVHNGPEGPGTEVGGADAGSTLPTGKGVVAKENVHEVHVISGGIKLNKVITDSLISSEDQTFTFTLRRQEDGFEQTLTVTVPAGQTQGSVAVYGLSRGTYVVTETAGDAFALKGMTVLETTNCHSTPAVGGTAKELIFHMGYDAADADVIGRADGDDYTSYLGTPNGVFGEAEIVNGEISLNAELPVTKVWSDGAENHENDAVYVALYQKVGDTDQLVTDANGNARVLRLDAANGWTGSFTVPLASKDDLLSNYGYSVREVELGDKGQAAVLENDGTTVVYIAKAVEAGKTISINYKAYQVSYGQSGDSWTVTNVRAVELPMTGGMGTTAFYVLGAVLTLAAVVLLITRKRMNGMN